MSERSREIPASLMDLPRMERYFEEQAEKGLLLSRISGFWGSGNAVLEDIVGDTYHFCIRPFEKEDLERLKTEFENCGWTLACTRGSLAIFHAKTPERPPVPACAQEKLREMLQKRVCREERKLLAALQLLMMAIELPMFYVIFSPLYFEIGTDIFMQGRGFAVMAVSYLILSISFCLGQWTRHFQAARGLKAGKNFLEQIPFWNKSAQMSLGLAGLTLAFIYMGWLFGDIESTRRSICCLLACAANIAVNMYWHKNAGLHRWRFIPWLLSPAVVLLFFWTLVHMR